MKGYPLQQLYAPCRHLKMDEYWLKMTVGTYPDPTAIGLLALTVIPKRDKNSEWRQESLLREALKLHCALYNYVCPCHPNQVSQQHAMFNSKTS